VVKGYSLTLPHLTCHLQVLKMIETIISIDLKKTAMEETRPIFHNRWHPDIPPVVSVKSGDAFRVECFDFSGTVLFLV
jgi:acetamidase/formamidase